MNMQQVLVLEIVAVSLRKAWLIRRACKPILLSPISPSISALGVRAATELNYAFETAFKAFVSDPEDGLLIGRALTVLGEKAGIYGMIGGQVIDVKETGHAVTKEVLDTIYELKTAALIEASMMIGAILAGATEEEVKKVEKIAHYVGIAFQIQDDILDVTSTEEVLGKPIHSDEKNEKTTYVTLMGTTEAGKVVEELSEKAIGLLHQLSGENKYLEQLLIQLIHRDK